MTQKCCFTCGDSRHLQKDCPKIYRRQNGGSLRGQFNQMRLNPTSQERGNFNNAQNDSKYSTGQYNQSRGHFRGGFSTYRGNFRGNYRGNYTNHRGRNFMQNEYRSRSNQDDSNYGQNSRGSHYVQNSTRFQYQEQSSDDHDKTEESENRISFLGQVNGNKVNNKSEGKLNFLIDSGCTDHMINDKSYFTDIIMLKNPLKIAIAEDSNYLLAVGVGNIDAYSIINNKSTIHFKECSLCTRFKKKFAFSKEIRYCEYISNF